MSIIRSSSDLSFAGFAAQAAFGGRSWSTAPTPAGVRRNCDLPTDYAIASARERGRSRSFAVLLNCCARPQKLSLEFKETARRTPPVGNPTLTRSASEVFLEFTSLALRVIVERVAFFKARARIPNSTIRFSER
jgi:hypothetical protein